MTVREREHRLENAAHACSVSIHPKVYPVFMTRTNIEIDDLLIDRAMRLYRLRSKREAVDLALRKLVGEPMSRQEALATEGTGWAGDLTEVRSREEIPGP
jgi:Arc/MetJ family transcription regulator